MKSRCSILWFRQDFRLQDHPALIHAAEKGDILAVYAQSSKILDGLGSVAAWRLKASLEKLNQSLAHRLNVYNVELGELLPALMEKYEVTGIFCHRYYEPWHRQEEENVRNWCEKMGIPFQSFQGHYLQDPEKLLKMDQTYYKVFSPFQRNFLKTPPSKPIGTARAVRFFRDFGDPRQTDVTKLFSQLSWPKGLDEDVVKQAGENEALEKMEGFIHHGLEKYHEKRDYPGDFHVSQLSSFLHFGELSIHRLWWAVQEKKSQETWVQGVESFLKELLWREFAAYLLFYFPDLPHKNFQKSFDDFSWESLENHAFFRLWKEGKTGYPLVDAGMRQLMKTGSMHNRVRMVAASFLTKNLNIHWNLGEAWFWERLLDADLASNSMNWQWVAGCGVDAAPYFRIFNPVLQGQSWDFDGRYTLKWLPELKVLPLKFLFNPWQMSSNKIEGGFLDYPGPCVSWESSKVAALTRYQSLISKKQNSPYENQR